MMSLSKLLSLVLIVFISFSCGKLDKDCDKDNKCTFCEDEKFEGKGRAMGWLKDKLEDHDDDDFERDGDWDGDEDFSNEWDENEIEREHNKDGRCGNSMQQIIVEELVIDESCGCIVDGMVKYVKNGETIALIKYNDPECEGYAFKILCDDGDCEGKEAKCCKFEQDCDSEIGEISIH
ncbi:hypothetical protein N8Z47_02060 [Salibacteraceae bacterium]|nr:hypothetical protein [Salibacteraceae bacterium]